MAENQALKAFDNREKAVLKELESYYAEMLDELTDKVEKMRQQAVNLVVGDETAQAQAESKIYRYEYQKRLKQEVEATLERLRSNEYDSIEQFLQDSYTNGYVGTLHEFAEQGVPVIATIDQESVIRAIQLDSQLSKPLYESLGYDTKKLKSQIRQEITRGIASNMTSAEIARNLQNASGISLRRAKTIARTESHRIRETASFDAGLKAKAKGADLVKEWVATRDDRVRDTHRRLDGQFRELEEEFEIDGKKALFPGAFGRPEEDCNCHCHTNKVLRWLLGEEELQRMHERAAIWGLEDDEGKVAQYREYEKRFLSLSEEESKNEFESTVVSPFVNSPKYRKQFERLPEPVKIQRVAYASSKSMVNHRSGTQFEDLTFIDSITGKYITRTDYDKIREVIPSKRMIEFATTREPNTIIAIHNHPGNSVPSMSDIRTAFKQKYKYGVIACHNGNLFTYKVTGEYNEVRTNIYLDRLNNLLYNSNGFTEKELEKVISALESENVFMGVYVT